MNAFACVLLKNRNFFIYKSVRDMLSVTLSSSENILFLDTCEVVSLFAMEKDTEAIAFVRFLYYHYSRYLVN